jgi:GNAT superfamily N-acetyltransferase
LSTDAAGLHALLGRALPDEGLTLDDVVTCCFGPESEVLGDDSAAAVVKFHDWGGYAAAWIIAVAVAPERQRRGVGRDLVEEAVAWAGVRGAHEVHVGTAIPRYLWPGVDFAFTPALCLFEAAGFQPDGFAYDMVIPTRFRADPPSGVTVERERGTGAIELARRAYPNWEDEVTRGIERGTCFSARAVDGAPIGFGAHSVNRRALIGPMATDPERQARGVGNALLAALCVDIEARDGSTSAQISWIGPARFYAKAGATVSRVYLNAKRRPG